MIRIETETDDDYWEVEALFDLCFAPGREALSSYRLRDNVPKVANLCLVARDETQILAGAIRYWPVRIDTAPVLLLGPVAVHPTRQSEGIARTLIIESLDLAKNTGWERIMLVGDAPYYMKFGFRRLEGVQMPPPTNPDRVLGLALENGAWEGISGLIEKAAP